MVVREAALLVSVFSAGVSVGFGGLPPATASHLAAHLRSASAAAAPPGVVSPANPSPAPAPVTAFRADTVPSLPSLPSLAPLESSELRALRWAESDPSGDERDPATSAAPTGVSLCGAGLERRVCSAYEPQGGADTSWLVGLRAPELPVRASDRVERFLEYLTQSTDGRRMFRTWYRRSGPYHDEIVRALRDRGLPEDLEAMVYVESGYSPDAVSSTGAAGLWQFMPATARVYGLAVERDYDERRSVQKSTEAAMRYLSDLYDRFGSWELALAAYDMGYGKLTQRVQEISSNDYWTLSRLPGALPDETVGYVPKVLAVALLLRNKDRFGIDDLALEEPVPVSGLEVPGGTPLSLVARAAGTSLHHIRAINPEILGASVPERAAPLLLQVPSSGLARANAMLPRLLSRQHRMDPDERVSDAFDWGTDETPAPARPSDAGTPDDDREVDSASRSARVPVYYSVGPRETLASISGRFSIDTADILADNHLDPAAKLQKGMLLQLHVPRTALRTLASTRLADDGTTPTDAAGLSGKGKP